MNTRYSALQQTCHWLLFPLCLAQFWTAGSVHKAHVQHIFGGARSGGFEASVAAAHEWIGWSIAILAVALFASRLAKGTPDLPQGMAPWQRGAAVTSHMVTYICLIALTLSGTAAMSVGGTYGSWHVLLTEIGVALIMIHVLAATWHQLIRRDHILVRMLPWFRADR